MIAAAPAQSRPLPTLSSLGDRQTLAALAGSRENTGAKTAKHDISRLPKMMKQDLGRSPDSVAAQMDPNSLDTSEMSLRDHLLAASQPQHHQQHTNHHQPNSAQQPQQSSPSSRILAPSPPHHPHSQSPHNAPAQPMEYAPRQTHQRHAADAGAPYSTHTQQIAEGLAELMQQQQQQSRMGSMGTGGGHGLAPMPEGGLPPSPGGHAGSSSDGRSRKRELSQSKRAAQNRAAQRAFRQRKESYIKKLEDDVRNAAGVAALQEGYHRVQSENYHLRDYIMALQSRLLEIHGDFPPPPSDLELRDPRQFQQQDGESASHAPMTSMGDDGAVEQLQAAAAQAAGFGGEVDEKHDASAARQ